MRLCLNPALNYIYCAIYYYTRRSYHYKHLKDRGVESNMSLPAQPIILMLLIPGSYHKCRCVFFFSIVGILYPDFAFKLFILLSILVTYYQYFLI